MKKYLLLIPLILLISCSPSLTVAWQEPDFKGDHFEKLVVVAIHRNLEVRDAFETSAVRLLKNKGIRAYHGVDFFPPTLDPSLHSAESLRKIVEENEIDGIITMSLIEHGQSQQYVQGAVYNAPPYYDPYGGYVYNRYNTVYTPGYYVDHETYLIEAVLHDLNLGNEEEHQLVWRGQSTLVDPSTVNSASHEFNVAMVKHLVKYEVVK